MPPPFRLTRAWRQPCILLVLAYLRWPASAKPRTLGAISYHLMKVTRTINPLHFEDLEPHRFEDLIRQLVYDLKDWKSIEATGRLGSDDGIDILAIENYIEGTGDIDDAESVNTDRIWIVQCKREQNISPKKIVQIVESDISKQLEIPYGYILASSSNFSKKARESFKHTLNKLGVQEFYIYGKAEIEDLLFQPKYDHLLFAYFGVSLQKRRRSIKTQLSNRLTTKRKLIKTIGSFTEVRNKKIFVRSAESLEYPRLNDNKPLWRFYEIMFYMPADCISLVTKRHLAYANWENEEWDIIHNYDDSFPRYPEIMEYDYDSDSNVANRSHAYERWNTIDPVNKAFFIEIRPVHFDRIVLVDELGDAFHEPPHLIVDFINDSPFEDRSFTVIEGANSSQFIKTPNTNKKIKIF